MKESILLPLLLLLATTTNQSTLAQGGAGCRTTTSTQSISCPTPSSPCTPVYTGGCTDNEYQEDSTQTFCNSEGTTTTCGYSVICCTPQSDNTNNNSGGGGRVGGGGGMMVPQSSSTSNGGTCGNGNRGNGICPKQDECCSEHGYCGSTSEHCGGSSQATSSDWWDPTTSSSTRYTDMYSPTWNGQPLPSNQQQQQQLRSSPNDYTRAASPAQQAGAGAGLGFAFVVIVIAACYMYRKEQNKADCPGGIPTTGAGRGGGVLDPDGGSLAMRYGIDSSSSEEEDSSSDDEEGGGGGRSRRSRKMGRDPSVYGQISTNGGGKSTSSRKMGRDPSVTAAVGGTSNWSGSGSGSGSGGSSKRRVVVDDSDVRSHRSSTKSREGGRRSRDPSINNGSSNGSGSSKKMKKKKPQYPAPAPPRPPPATNKLGRKLSNGTSGSNDTNSRKQRQEWVKKTIYDTGSEGGGDEDGLDDDTDSQLNWAA